MRAWIGRAQIATAELKGRRWSKVRSRQRLHLCSVPCGVQKRLLGVTAINDSELQISVVNTLWASRYVDGIISE
jgi:hypothetical protein